MKKIEKHIIGFELDPILFRSRTKIERKDWYCNAVEHLNKQRIPDHFDITINDPIKKEIITSIYKDTSDSNVDNEGNLKLFIDIPKLPKYQKIHKFSDSGLLIKMIRVNNNEVDNFTNFTYDSKGNLTLLEYNRLGYVQYKMEYEHDSFGNLIKLIHSEDDSHGNEQFVVKSESIYSYQFENKIIKNDNYKFINDERIHRSITMYEYENLAEITKVKLTMKDLRTQSESTLWKSYDKFSNPIENFSYQNEKLHPHSMKYKYEFDNQNNWIRRERRTMTNVLTLLTERKIEY